MKIKPILLMLSLLLMLPLVVFAQKRKPKKVAVKPPVSSAPKAAAQSTAQFYLDIDRPDCCRLTAENWQSIARILRRKRISGFFGSYSILDYREAWHPVELKKTAGEEDGSLILGPFASSKVAEKALLQLPKLLPTMGDDFRGIEAGATDEAQTWRVGMYQITGIKTQMPVAATPPVNRSAGTIEGTIVETTGGANWFGIIVESSGVKYLIQLDGNSGGVKSTAGDVETVGNRVSITYRNKQTRTDGSYVLEATRIVQIK